MDSQPRPWYLRWAAGIGGIGCFAVLTVLTLGTVLAAPAGMFVVDKWAKRRAKVPTGLASWIAACSASAIATLALVVLTLTVLPGSTWGEMKKAAMHAQDAPPPRLPAWMPRPSTRPVEQDSTVARVTRSPLFVEASMIYGLAFAAMLLGVVAGSAGWISTKMLRFALR